MSLQEFAFVMALSALTISLAALWYAAQPVERYRKWKLRFGKRGIPGWFAGQWYRLRGFKPDYRMKEAPPPEMSDMFGKALGPQEELSGGKSWAPPACSKFEPRVMKPWDFDDQRKAMPDWSNLTDAELEEKLKTARLGDGLVAEAGVRMHRRIQATPEGPEKDRLLDFYETTYGKPPQEDDSK